MGLKTIPLMISREDVVPWMELCMVNQSKKPDQELSISRLPGKDIESTVWTHPNVQNESPCEFIRHLQGSKKGDKVECVDQLKKFLHYFGYLNHGGLNNDEVGGDYFDETIERALKTYQINFNLKPTGVLDAETVSLMMKPRCGVPDIVDGKTRMKSAGSYNIDCAFFPGSPKGQKLRKYLTGDIDLSNLSVADITIGFLKNGQGGMDKGKQAFAAPPTDGRVFFNADLNWYLGQPQGPLTF
ncbi:hypothetical protein H0E87_011858 [Populus deltoides]|uniref:Peptidoglycan binding-like domain-containing protein n=1 Tax=Populus deltoides TaxID=3696 RepID=A0A8T2YGX4_POPDE|nr:hypothetical protein H0E87_011858 [Populus deltoides]